MVWKYFTAEQGRRHKEGQARQTDKQAHTQAHTAVHTEAHTERERAEGTEAEPDLPPHKQGKHRAKPSAN